MDYKLKGDVVLREIGGEHMAVPVGNISKELNGLISLSPSGEVLMRKLQEGCSFDALVDALLDKYDVGREQAEADTRRFLEKLKGLGLL